MSEPTQIIVLYDHDCGFCRWALAKILRWDRHGRLRPSPIQGEEGKRLLAGKSEEERLASWHLFADGRIHSAGAAFEPMLRALPGGRPLAAFSKRFPRLTNRAYRAVAGRRGMIGPRLSDGARRRADRRIAARS